MPTPVETTALDHRRAAVVVVELIADNLSAHKVEVATEDVTLVDAG